MSFWANEVQSIVQSLNQFSFMKVWQIHKKVHLFQKYHFWFIFLLCFLEAGEPVVNWLDNKTQVYTYTHFQVSQNLVYCCQWHVKCIFIFQSSECSVWKMFFLFGWNFSISQITFTVNCFCCWVKVIYFCLIVHCSVPAACWMGPNGP